MPAKVLMNNRDTDPAGIVYEHDTDDKAAAITAAKAAHPTYSFCRVWIGESGQHKISRLNVEPTSEIVKAICQKGGFKKVRM